MTSAKSPVQSITFEWKEGLEHEMKQLPLTVHSWAEARAKLREWSNTAPKDGSYNKVGFKVAWKSGDTYEGRYDLQHLSVQGERCDVAAHVSGYLNFLAGNARPAHMSAEQYASYLASVTEHTAVAKDMLERLSFED